MIGILLLDEYAPTRSCPERRPWVARLLGPSPRHTYERVFVDSQRDWREADKKGRGVKHCFTLEYGHLYEVCRWRKRDKSERYFVRVDPTGDLVGVRHEDVDRILTEAQCARDERIRQLLAEFDQLQANVSSASTS